jgi:hypothetical protein
MKKFTVSDIKVGRVFVGASGKRARQVVVIKEGQAFYRSFILPSGTYKETAVCSVGFMGDWAERYITPDEFSFLEIAEAERAEKGKSQENQSANK